MDLNKLSRGDQVIGISGIVLFISSFLSWFKADFRGQEVASGNAWDFTIAWVAVIIGVLMVAYVILKAASVDLPEAPWPLILLIAGGLAFVFVLLKLIAGVDVDTGPFDVDVDTKRQIGIFIALVASAGLGVGAWLNFQESRAGGGTPSAGGSSGGGPTV